ncbi:ABC transporter permease [Ketogulonicigenium vulgare]|uniref:Sugar ABC transporter, permease protein n=1 Tax=Ketogulonicigenium vulgare (strain WSH-001) TaxID=759362 RepID=F9Y8V6_KETVW|nr:ABC transporter permease [Ketogulonicigenium vulgare]AEM42433.1 Sugar ABC transporter, permease protein [Ketogulonicigenium vulgare WSH-001]ALJ80050.1 sugar ABC transporter permease [Ketogulonicigenium vulgare]ANW32932.1 sugar ABC transporter permease [Ketogulonicigenium vulgare]AOZ53523.1 Sugar ABC transporter, permease protein [Ketogulonicigenium vulgare]
MIRLEKRPTHSHVWTWATPLIAVLATMIAGGLMFMLLGKDPFATLRTIFWDPLFGQHASYYRGQLLIKAGPLILIAVGLSFGFRAGIWNIGAEGQYIVGAICGAAVALAFYPAAGWYIFPLMVIAGALGGMAWGLIPGILRVRYGASETLVSLMLVYVAERLVAQMALGAMRNPEGMGMPGSRVISRYPAAANTEIFAGTGMHWGVVAALIAVIVAYVALSRHMFGFNIRLAGQSPRAAAFSGVQPGKLILICTGLSGALAGLAGMFEVAGPAGRISIDFGVGYGFTAIIVAFLGRLHPVGILLAGLLLALTYIGGESAQTAIGLPAAAIQMFQGMLLFFLLAFDVLTNYRLRLARPKAKEVA